MSSLTIFQFDTKQIRTGEIEGRPVFCLIDLLAAMGTSVDTSKAKSALTEVFGDGVTICLPTLDTLGRTQETMFVFEHGATFIISRSRTEIGKKLNRWLHGEVIPSIRKTGSYQVNPEPQPLQRQLAPQRDLLDYLEAAKSIGIDQDPLLKSLFSQRMAEQLGGAALPATQQVIATVRAQELGYSQKEIGNGSQLGKFLVKQGCQPTGKTQHGRYPVNVFDLDSNLDRAIHLYFS